MTSNIDIEEFEDKANIIRDVFGGSQLEDGWLEEDTFMAFEELENKEPGAYIATAGFKWERTKHSIRISVDPSLYSWVIPLDAWEEE